jgi:flagellar hook-associated protein 2
MATGNISSPGLGSNLDVTTLVNNLMSFEQRPLQLLDAKEATLQAQISLLGGLKGALSGFQGANDALKSLVAKTNFKATASDAAVVTPVASSTVGAGVYAVSVTDIAQSQRLGATGQASQTAAIGLGGATTISFTFGTISGGTLDTDGIYAGATFTGSGATAVSVSIDQTNNTLEGIRDAINAANAGVTASIVNDGSATPYRLILNASGTGAAKSMKIEVTGESAISDLLSYDPAGTQQLNQLQAAQDAKLSVDGIPITSATNAVTGVVDGLTFNLKAPGSSTVTVARDYTQVTTAVTNLVKAYNDASGAFASATAKGAGLQGNSGVVGTLNSLRTEIGALRPGLGSFQALSQLGIQFQRDGSLTLDTARLTSALNSDYAGASALLGRFTGSMSTLTRTMLGESGSLTAQTNGITRSIDAIDSQRERIGRRLEAVQARYLAQFSALDAMISSMKSTSTFLEQQLANIPVPGKDQ